ncbi:MAG: 1-deoxy-D-xylulose-5-phosphate reductoisomerase [Lachnospiraceae bacterium]
MKKIAILGSTGSIGTQTLEIARKNCELEIVALAAKSNTILLEKQVREFMPKVIAIWDEEAAKELSIKLADLDVTVLSGMDGLLYISTMEDIDIVVTALVGMIGIRPTIEAIKAGKNIALANKETLVTAGHIIMPLAKEKNVSIYPVDSEHSAIFQSLNGEHKNQVSKIILTASGGPFLGKTKEELEYVTLKEALKHPNWAMGKKITIDSSTLVNKGLEVMEAKWLFDVNVDQIQVVIHPQSIIHSMVEYVDGAIMAQLGTPDMKLPIQYALFYPDRKEMEGKKLNFHEIKNLTFDKPDMDTFRGLQLAYDALTIGNSMPTVYNAANELAVSLFLEEKISYLQITQLIEETMEKHKIVKNPCLEDIIEIEKESHQFIEEKVKKGLTK